MSASIIESIKGLSAAELLKIIKACAAEAEKKGASQKPKEPKEKKGSMPKGVVPPQLVKPRAWVEFTLKHANEHGWESFDIKEKGMDVTVPESVNKDGVHVFELTGKGLIHKHAMSLSKVRWTPKTSTGTNEALYRTFEASYVPEEPKAKEAVQEEKLAVLAKKAQEKEEKALIQAEKKEKKAKEPKEPKEPKAKSVPKKEEDTFAIEDDGSVMQWDFKGKSYLRNFAGQLWLCTSEGEMGAWCGVLNPKTMKIDDSVPEPIFEDE